MRALVLAAACFIWFFPDQAGAETPKFESREPPGPYSLIDRTETSFGKPPESVRLDASLHWDPAEVQPGKIEVGATLIDPFGIRPERSFTLEPLWDLPRPGLRYLVEVPLDQCEGATLVVWSVLIDGKAIKSVPQSTLWLGMRGGEECIGIDPRGPRGPWLVNIDVDEADANPGDGLCSIRSNPVRCSLRAAIEESNALPGPDEIGFTVDLVYLRPNMGSLVPTEAVLIRGNGRDVTRIDTAKADYTPFRIPTLVPFTMQALSIRGPTAGATSASKLYPRTAPLQQAGAFVTDGLFALADVTIDGTHGTVSGAISATNPTTLRRVRIVGTTPGALSTNNANTLIEDSTISGTFSGSSVFTLVGWSTQIENSTLANNLLQPGQAAIVVAGSGQIGLRNVTIAGNKGLREGALANYGGRATLSNVLLANPEADDPVTPGQRTQAECRVGTGGGSIPPVIISDGHNFLDNVDGCTVQADAGDQFGVGQVLNPMLAPLSAGPSGREAFALRSGSPARDAGFPGAPDASNPAACLPTDQHGTARPINGRCDIGAVEQ